MIASPAPSVLIAGLGNPLCMDDGVGVHAVQALRKAPPPHTLLADVGTAILHLLPYLERVRFALLIDAMEAGGPPGSIYQVPLCRVREERNHSSGLHAVGVREALRWLPAGKRPADILVLGVEPEKIAYSLTLSPAVQRALPEVARRVRRTTNEWQAQGQTQFRR